jgi:putative ABC transport system ATP-binding protein
MTAAPDTPLYDLRNVVKQYGSGETVITAVDGVDMRVEHGELTVIAGPSGSGKTTLLQLLGALDRPTGGEVLLEGRHLDGMSDAELATLRRERIGFVFQQFNLIPTLTAAQNVEAAMAPTRRAGRERRARELLERVGLGHRLSRSRGRWPTARTWCWPTSRPATSTAAPASRSSRCSASSTGRSA